MKLFLVILLLALASRANADPVVDRIRAIVGDDIILQSDLEKARALGGSRFSSKTRLTESETLEELVKEKIVRQEVKKSGITVSADEMKQAKAAILYENRMTLPQLKAELKSKGITFEDYEKELEERIRTTKFMQQIIGMRVAVTEEDEATYRKRHPQQAKQESEMEMHNNILQKKSQEELERFLAEARARSYVDIKD